MRITQYYGFPVSTVVAIQGRLGLNRLSRLEPLRPIIRYEHARPGPWCTSTRRNNRFERIGHRIHGDRRRRSRRVGWEHVHVAIDDCTRLGYVEVLPRDDGPTTASFVQRALAWFRSIGIRVRAILTDNAKCYICAPLQAVLTERRHSALNFLTPAQRLAERL